MVTKANKSPLSNESLVEFSPLSRISRIPLHQQIYEILRSKILQGIWASGVLFPTEMELMAEYQVSRATIRQVMERLVREGLVFRQQGRGTFVAEPTLEQGLTRIISFTEDMRRRGLVPETKILAEEIILANPDVSRALNLREAENVAYLKRLRLANNEALCIEESFISEALCPGLFETDFSVQPLRETLDDKFGIRIVRALQKIHAITASHEIAKELKIPSNSALLYIERTSFNQLDQPIEFLRLYFRGDRYSLYNEIRD